MSSRLEKATEIVKWAIDHKKSLREAQTHFNVGEGFLRKTKARHSGKEGYKEFMELYKSFHHTATPSQLGKTTYSETDNSASYEYSGTKSIKTLEEAIELFKIDLSIWEVERWVCNSWDVNARAREQDLSWKDGVMNGYAVREDAWRTTTNYQIKVWLKKRVVHQQAIDFEGFYKNLLAKHEPFKYQPISYTLPNEINLLELNIFDLHLGKLCWGEEVNNYYDSKIASQRFNYALKTLLKRAESSQFERIVFPIGNDFFNSDGHLNTTTMGTRQDEDSRWHKTFKTGVNLLVEGIDYLRQYAPVDVLVIPGNHDFTKSYFLGETLAAWYRNDTCVSINNSPNPRKYYEYGNVLLGFTHGNNEKIEALRSLMAFEAKEAWGRTVYKEFHLGHQHRKLSVKHVVKSNLTHEELGIVVRSMASVAGTDAWHHTMGYVGPVRAAEAFLWNKETGLIGNFNVNIKL